MTTVVWKYNQLVLNAPLSLGALAHGDSSVEYEIQLSHDSNQKITECGFYISPYTGVYNGTHSPIKDYERVLWLANNYPGYGLSIRQSYSISGEIDSGSNVRYIDLDRPEPMDVFAGESFEITSGPESGNSVLIESFDPSRKLFFTENTFVNDIVGENYKVDVNKEHFFKTGQGASYLSPIQLIHGGGVLNRLESTTVYLRMRIPQFALSAGSFLFDLNLRFTSLEE